jgi:hypothetical protein
MSIFMRQIDRKASLDLLFQIEDELLKNPTRGALIPGASGVRKARVGDADRGKGKRGGYRFPRSAFRTPRFPTDLSPDQKKALAGVAESIKKEISK